VLRDATVKVCLRALVACYLRFSYGAQWAGQAAALARELPAAELMARLQAELRESIAGLQRYASR
jgi:nitronate monooxygenase